MPEPTPVLVSGSEASPGQERTTNSVAVDGGAPTAAEDDALLGGGNAGGGGDGGSGGGEKGKRKPGFMRRMSSRVFSSGKTRGPLASSMMAAAGHGDGFDPSHPANFYRPERIFLAHAGMTVSPKASGTYRFIVGPKAWLMTVDDTGKVTVSGPEDATPASVDETVGVTGTIKYDSEKTWIRNFSGKANAMKLMVLGKLKFDGDMKKAEALNPLFEPKTLEPALKALPADEGASTTAGEAAGTCERAVTTMYPNH